MGIDVFGVFQRKEHGDWIYIKTDDTYYGLRDGLKYWLGWGGGGNIRGCRIEPIACLRGLPTDFELSDDGGYKPDKDKELTIGMGYPPFSWLLADEILDASPLLGMRTITLSDDVFKKSWLYESDLALWISMTGAMELNDDNVDSPKLVCVSSRPEAVEIGKNEIPIDCMYDFGSWFSYFTDEVLYLKRQYGEVRFVFGFA